MNYGIIKLHEMLKNNETTVEELVNDSLKKAHELQEKCNAFVTIMDDNKVEVNVPYLMW